MKTTTLRKNLTMAILIAALAVPVPMVSQTHRGNDRPNRIERPAGNRPAPDRPTRRPGNNRPAPGPRVVLPSVPATTALPRIVLPSVPATTALPRVVLNNVQTARHLHRHVTNGRPTTGTDPCRHRPGDTVCHAPCRTVRECCLGVTGHTFMPLPYVRYSALHSAHYMARLSTTCSIMVTPSTAMPTTPYT